MRRSRVRAHRRQMRTEAMDLQEVVEAKAAVEADLVERN